MYLFKRSDWRITGSSGVTATAGTPNLKIQLGGSFIRLPVKKEGTNTSGILGGVGLGGQGGGGVEAPWTDFVNVSGSPQFYPSKGIGQIYRKINKPDYSYSLQKLTGQFMVIAATGSINFYGATFCMGLWLDNYIGECINDFRNCKISIVLTETGLRLLPGAIPLSILIKTHAVGLFWGGVNTTDISSASISVFKYHLTEVA
jgi:hypothetical protein